MKRRIILLLVSVFTLALFAQSAGVTGEYLSSLGDKKSYKLVQKEQGVEICETFLQAFPESKYRKKVYAIYDMRYYIEAYDVATKTFDLDKLESYLEEFTIGEYRVKAEEAIDIISFQKAKSENTIEAYEDYLKKFPEGRASAMAQKAIVTLK